MRLCYTTNFFFFPPQDAVVARQYQDNIHIYRATAQHWAAAYAGSDYKVGRLLIAERLFLLNQTLY